MEATAIGNVMMQALALGLVGSLAEAREVVRQSFGTRTYEPRDTQRWEDANSKFTSLLE